MSRFGRFVAALAFFVAGVSLHTQTPNKLDPLLQQRLNNPIGQSKIILTASSPEALDAIASSIQLAGGTVGRRLALITGMAATVPNTLLATLSANPTVQHLAYDRAIGGSMERTAATVGATAVRQSLGVDGSGIGVAIIDSGVLASHDDLSHSQRVVQFVDFVGGAPTPVDAYGHGTHVAGIIAGNGFDSDGARSGIAPGANLIVLRVLDGSGHGQISNVIAALEYAVVHKTEFNIRIANLSIGAGVYESAQVDPLTVAAKRAVEAGIVVVAAAGNLGRRDGMPLSGGITAPGNAPWVLTVGASSHMGTIDRSDDTVAPFSSRGPTAYDGIAKPDIVAPGVGIESLSAPGSLFYSSMAQYLLPGTVATAYLPYLSLTGTSMAAPVVSGTVALMLQANPALTPNEVKAILQYTAQASPNYDVLTQGAGFLDAQGAVQLAHAFATYADEPDPSTTSWARHLIWGKRYVWGGRLFRDTPAWSPNVPWGDPNTPSTSLMLWPSDPSQSEGGSGTGGYGGGISGTSEDGSVVWGTSDDGDGSVVWGTGDDGDGSVVWGTNCSDPSCEPNVWRNQ